MRPAVATLMILGCLMSRPCPAAAASFDCTATLSRVERMICADAALSMADSALGAVFAEALAASPHPQGLRAEQREWITAGRDKVMVPNDLLAAYQKRTKELQTRVADWQAVRQSVGVTAPDKCLKLLEADDAVCTVSETGKLDGAPGGTLRYRLQTWQNGDTTMATGIVVLAGVDGNLRPLTWSAEEDTHYEAPAILQTPQGTLLDLPGHFAGTGNLSAESLFVFREGGWHEIDVNFWLGQLEARLPKGLGAWKGIYPDWRAMTAQTPLWREGDGNCCPQGGSATVVLRLDRDRIVLMSLRLLPDR